MSSGNDSLIQQTTRDFHCCCSISPEGFPVNGLTTAVYIFKTIVLVPTSISATLGNLLVLISIWRTPSLHSPSHVLLFGLALSDLGVGLVAEPIAFVNSIAKMKGLVGIFCKGTVAVRFAAALLCFASLFTTTAISLDMYIALSLHLRYQEIVTVKRMTGVLVGIWVCSLTAGLLFVWKKQQLSLLWMSLILLCLFVTTSSYGRIFLIVRHHQKRIKTQMQVLQKSEDQEETLPCLTQHRESLINKFIVYCTLLIFYLPFVVMTLVVAMDLSVTNQSLYEISFVWVCFNSTLNPFVYCWRFQKIRAAVIETTKKIFKREILSQ